MASKRVVQLHHIAKWFQGNDRQLKRGEIAYIDGHVKSMHFIGSVQPMVLRGIVQASQKKSIEYQVGIDYKEEQGVINAKCTCAAGQDVCHHQAAVLLYGYNNISSTDVECHWKASAKKKKGASDDVRTLEEMHPPRRAYVATQRQITGEEIQSLKNSLGATNVVGFSWLLKEEIPESALSIIPSIEDILFSSEYLEAPDRTEYFVKACEVTEQQIHDIERCTVGQHMNESWLVGRKLRLTASKFGAVLNAIRRNFYPPSFFKNLMEEYDLQRAMVVQWGKQNKATALQKLIEVAHVDIKQCGLFLDKCGFLGASPDGLINDNSLVEIKCPYRYRDGNLKEAIQNKKDYFFWYNEAGDIVIKEDHQYYHHIQGQLFITNRLQCYFFVWTPGEYELLIIDRDPEWEKNVTLLQDFYLTKFIPYVCGIRGYSSDEAE